ncbi:MAG: hypothetical protein ACYC8S_03700 [Minisyncoccota bacterium]
MKILFRALIALCMLLPFFAKAENNGNVIVLSCQPVWAKEWKPGADNSSSTADGFWAKNFAGSKKYPRKEYHRLFAAVQSIPNTDRAFKLLSAKKQWCIPTLVEYKKIITLTLVRGNDGLYHPMKTVVQKPKKEAVVPIAPVVKQKLAPAPVQEEWHPKLLPTTLPRIDTLAHSASFGFKLNDGVILVILVAMVVGVLVWLALGGLRNSRRPHHIVVGHKVGDEPTLNEHMAYQEELQGVKLQLAQEKYNGATAAEEIKALERMIVFLQEDVAVTKRISTQLKK